MHYIRHRLLDRHRNLVHNVRHLAHKLHAHHMSHQTHPHMHHLEKGSGMLSFPKKYSTMPVIPDLSKVKSGGRVRVSMKPLKLRL